MTKPRRHVCTTPSAARWSVIALLALAGAAQGQSGSSPFGRSEHSAGSRNTRSTGWGTRTLVSHGTDSAHRTPVIDLTRQARLRRPGQVLPGDSLPALAAHPDSSNSFAADGLHAMHDAGEVVARNEQDPRGLEPSMGTLPALPGQPDEHESNAMDPLIDPTLDAPTPEPVSQLSEPEADWHPTHEHLEPTETARSWQVSESIVVTDLGVNGEFSGLVETPVAIAAEQPNFDPASSPDPQDAPWQEEADRPRVIALRDDTPADMQALAPESAMTETTEPIEARSATTAIVMAEPRLVEPTLAEPNLVEPDLVEPTRIEPATTVSGTVNLPQAEPAPREPVVAIIDERALVARPEAYPQPAPIKRDNTAPSGLKAPVVELDDGPRAAPRPATPPASATTLADRPLDPSATGRSTSVRPPVVSPLSPEAPVATTTPGARTAQPAIPQMPRPTTIDPAFPIGPVRDAVIDLAGPHDRPLSILDRTADDFPPEPGFNNDPLVPLSPEAELPAPGVSTAATQRLSVAMIEGSISNVQWRSVSASPSAVTDWTTPRIGEDREGAIEIRTGVGAGVQIRLDDHSILEVDRLSRVIVTPGGQAEGFGTAPARVELGRGRVHLRAIDPTRPPAATVVTPDQTFDLQTTATIDYSAYVGSRRSAGE